jgi:hypothetical protein
MPKRVIFPHDPMGSGGLGIVTPASLGASGRRIERVTLEVILSTIRGRIRLLCKPFDGVEGVWRRFDWGRN